MNIAMLLLRVVVGALFMGHGSQKLFGWFGGHGPGGTGQYFDSLGYRPGRMMALAGGAAEFFGGLLLAFGFLTPLAAAMIIGVMINAMLAVHWANGIWNSQGGIEYPLTLAVVAAAIAIAGPGRFSLDRALGLALDGGIIKAAGILLGLVAGVAIYAWRMVSTPAQEGGGAQSHRRRAA